MISELSDEQKSVMLARAIGWLYLSEVKLSRVINGQPAGSGSALCVMCEYPGQSGPWGLREDLYSGGEFTAWERVAKNLYDSDNMALAWYVLNWAAETLDNDVPHPVSRFVERSGFEAIPPAKAQRMWLDMVLGLAIEAGLVGTEYSNRYQ